eukprot:6261094-Prorocentrum_lima.AAC.1
MKPLNVHAKLVRDGGERLVVRFRNKQQSVQPGRRKRKDRVGLHVNAGAPYACGLDWARPGSAAKREGGRSHTQQREGREG